MDYVQYIPKILSLAKAILWMVTEVKANKKRCERVAQRVKALEELVLAISQRQLSPSINAALLDLCITLNSAHELIKKCTKAKFPLTLMKCKSKFSSVNERLTESFQVLSGALHVEQGNMKFQMLEDAYGMEDDDEDWDDESITASYEAIMYVKDGMVLFAERRSFQ